MARTYTIAFDAVAVSAAQDLWELRPADDKPIKILGMVLGQRSDVGDAASENLSLSIIRGFTASGSGGSTPTPAPNDTVDNAAGWGTDMNNTTVANTGTTETVFADVWNTQAGYQMWFPEGVQPTCNQGSTSIVVRITAPADAITASGTIFVQEG